MLRKIFEASPDSITVARLSDGTFFAVNDSFVKQFGYTREDTLGKRQDELGLFADPSRAREVLRGLRTDSALTNKELSLRRKDGAVAPYLISAAVTEIGSEQCVVGMTRDITDLKRTEQELVRAREAAIPPRRANTAGAGLASPSSRGWSG